MHPWPNYAYPITFACIPFSLHAFKQIATEQLSANSAMMNSTSKASQDCVLAWIIKQFTFLDSLVA